MALQPHEQRVVEEKEELDIKREKLDGFIRSQKFENVPMTERHLLREQLHYMDCYASTLGQRIAIFQKG